MQLLILSLLLIGGVRCALVCSQFTDISLAVQPITPGKDCTDNITLSGQCAVDGTECLTQQVFLNDSVASEPVIFTCAIDCIANTPCECAGANVCERTIEDTQFTFICAEGTPTTTTTTTTTPASTTTTSSPNFCDEDDELDVDCSKPSDDTATALITLFFIVFIALLCAAFCCVPRGRDSRTMD